MIGERGAKLPFGASFVRVFYRSRRLGQRAGDALPGGSAPSRCS
jgi:hypothetical protein